MRLLAYPHLFPVLILTLYGLASLRYAVAQDWPRCSYWLIAGGLTINVTWFR